MADHGAWQRLRRQLAVWRQRVCSRRELAALAARDRRDLGVRWEDTRREAAKPFWRR